MSSSSSSSTSSMELYRTSLALNNMGLVMLQNSNHTAAVDTFKASVALMNQASSSRCIVNTNNNATLRSFQTASQQLQESKTNKNNSTVQIIEDVDILTLREAVADSSRSTTAVIRISEFCCQGKHQINGMVSQQYVTVLYNQAVAHLVTATRTASSTETRREHLQQAQDCFETAVDMMDDLLEDQIEAGRPIFADLDQDRTLTLMLLSALAHHGLCQVYQNRMDGQQQTEKQIKNAQKMARYWREQAEERLPTSCATTTENRPTQSTKNNNNKTATWFQPRTAAAA